MHTLGALPLLLLLDGVPAHAETAALSRLRFVQRAAALVVSPLCLGEVYMQSPPPPWSERASDPLLLGASRKLVLLFPGAGGPDANTARIVNKLRARGDAVQLLDWSEQCGDTLRAPNNARRLGDRLGNELARSNPLPKLHVIGVSVGAHAADALTAAFRARAPETHIHLTLLDPFLARGIGGLVLSKAAYGVRRFGASADYCESLYNTDDPVPSTSSPVKQAVNYDLTLCKERSRFKPLPGDSLHSWPAAWYGTHCDELLDAAGVQPHHADGICRKRGTIIVVP